MAPQHAKTGAEKAGARQLNWRACARIFTAFVNAAMVGYVYMAHLAGLDWSDFGRSRVAEMGKSTSIRDYIWETETAFDHLRTFTFSEAMLENLSLYVVVGFPVAVILFALEHDRVRWLKSLLASNLPQDEAFRACRCLEWYLKSFSVTLLFIILIGPFHLGFPWMHYFCAVFAIGSGLVSISLYLAMPVDLAALAVAAGDDDAEVAVWTAAQRWVRPVLKFVLLLHGFVLAAAIWKAERLGDDWVALLFGILETSLVLGYQLFQGVFALDEMTRQVALRQQTGQAHVERKDANTKQAQVAEHVLGG